MVISIWTYVVLFLLIGLITGLFFLGIMLKKAFFVTKAEMVEGSASKWQDSILEVIKDLKTNVIDLRATQLKTVAEQTKADVSLIKSIQELPVRTLNTIQGSVNTTTGKLGELIKFIELQRTYDRIFPVGDIIDFIGVRFPNGEDKGAIDLIEIKTGDKAVLNTDQKKLRDMIANSKDTINFRVVKVEIA